MLVINGLYKNNRLRRQCRIELVRISQDVFPIFGFHMSHTWFINVFFPCLLSSCTSPRLESCYPLKITDVIRKQQTQIFRAGFAGGNGRSGVVPCLGSIRSLESRPTEPSVYCYKNHKVFVNARRPAGTLCGFLGF